MLVTTADRTTRTNSQPYPNMPPGEELVVARHAWEVGSGRVGRSRSAENPIKAATVAHIRHEYTDYEQILREGEGDSVYVRDVVGPQVAGILNSWAGKELDVIDRPAAERNPRKSR